MEISNHKMNYASDEQLLEKIIGGETMLFEILIRRYNPLLYKIARTYGFNHQDSEDLLQESHVAAYRYLASFRGDASYKTWLTKIHLNACYQKLRTGGLQFEPMSDEFFSGQAQAKLPADQATENKVLNRELGSVLEKSLQALPVAYRSVFVLREIEGFSVAETAELLGISSINVKVRFNRAKAMLQKKLESFYSAADLYEFHLMYCDKIVSNVFERIANANDC